MKPGHLLMTLSDPLLVRFSDADPGVDVEVGGRALEDFGWVPWGAMADLLIDSNSREFVGLSFGVGPELQEQVRQLSESLSPRVVRHRVGRMSHSVHGSVIDYACAEGAVSHYRVMPEPWSGVCRRADSELYSLEVIWGAGEPDAILAGALNEVNCYYQRNPGKAPASEMFWRIYNAEAVAAGTSASWLAVGVTDLPWLLDAFKVRLPAQYRVPVEWRRLLPQGAPDDA